MDKIKIVNEIQDILLEAKQQISILEKNIPQMMKFVKDESFIPKKLSDSIANALNSLSSSEKLCYDKFIMLDDKPGNKLSEIEERLNAIKEKVLVENIHSCASMFLKLKSDDNDIKNILDEEKNKLEVFLREGNNENIEPYAQFVRVLLADFSTNPPDAIPYIVSLSSQFPNDLVYNAAYTQKILVDTEESRENTYSTGDENITDINETAIDDDTDNTSAMDRMTEGQENKDDDITASSNILIPADALLPVDYKCGELDVEKNKREENKFGAKDFISDMHHKPIDRKIIKLTENAICATIKFFDSMISEANENEIQTEVDYLIKKGYMRRYILKGMGEFICLTNRGYKAFESKKASEFLKVPVKPKKPQESYLDDVPIFAASRVAYTRLMFDYSKAYEHNQYSITKNLGSASFFIENDFGTSSELVLSCFSVEDDDVFTLEEAIKISAGKHYDQIIFCGLTLDQTSAFAQSIKTRLECESSALYLYSASDDKFYDINKSEEISYTHIWPETEVTEIKDKVEQDNNTEAKVPKYEETGSDNLDDAEDSIEQETKTIEQPKNSDSPIIEESDSNTVNTEEILGNVYNMVISKQTYCASAYLNANSSNPEVCKLAKTFAYAVDDPLYECSYVSGNILDTLTDGSNSFYEMLTVAGALRTFFYNHIEYDYNLKTLHNIIKDYHVFDTSPSLTKLVYDIVSFKEKYKKGIDFFADYRAKDKAVLEKKLREINAAAKDGYDTIIQLPPRETTNHKRFLKTWGQVFQRNGDISELLKSIIDGDYSVIEYMTEYLKTNAIKKDSAITAKNLDKEKIFNNIVVPAWDQAAKELILQKKNETLKGSLKNNIINNIRKILTVMCDWIECTVNLTISDGNEASSYYHTQQIQMLENIEQAISEIGIMENSDKQDIKAGAFILKNVLEEFKMRLNGEYNEKTEKYFYIDFLLSDLIMLKPDNSAVKANYETDYLTNGFNYLMPIPDDTALIGTDMSLSSRILEHVQKDKPSYKDRLDELIKNDDYGSASYLDMYFVDIYGYSLLEEANYELSDDIASAKQGLKRELDQFVGDLELAQGYGQFVFTAENEFENIFRIVSDCYDYAISSNNFGYFKRICSYFIKKIRKDAKVHEERLNTALAPLVKEVNSDEQKEKIDRIRHLIEIQNYTVAEDLINRFDETDAATELDIFKIDYLRDFMSDYASYYEPVVKGSVSLNALIGNKINKNIRGAKVLAENWPINGASRIPEIQLQKLLSALGFEVGSVIKKPNITGKITCYTVMLKKPDDGRKINLKHPIAPFGSYAYESAFQIVILTGKYEADDILNTIKTIGTARHTIMLLDHALPSYERRRLARKIKAAAVMDKIFGVIDRVMIYYLMRNYNETSINAILMSIMLPFSYYQPYVPDSANYMPPEMFIGRSNELADIESASGANIVYGGRQLGKSKLLSMAKTDIDRNENKSRAVMVTVNNMNYEDTAVAVCSELKREGILNKNITTKNWRELADAIIDRLSETDANRRIEYLLLLIDEADEFLDSCSEVNYAPFEELKRIQQIGHERFKFVVAGLRNVVKFKRKVALGNNSVIAHLGDMTVKPFNYADGRSLIELPLYYLGLRFPEEKDYLISLILATTNYFPGLIQLYCCKLIEAMKVEYAGYNENSTPEYIVQEKHIKKVLADKSFQAEINRKFTITLDLDNDDYYYIIALLIAHRYYEEHATDGSTAEEILNMSKDIELNKLATLENEQLTALLDELCDLNILRRLPNNKYFFARYNFLKLMGTAKNVEDALLEKIYEEDN